MLVSLIIVAVLLGLALLARFVARQRKSDPRSARPSLPKTPPAVQSGVKVVPRPAAPPVVVPDFRTPPGTADLDDVDALRPEIDASALASTRLAVTQAVPDGVLADALLDATPAQLQHLFAAVPDNVLADALGGQHTTQQPLKAADLEQLKGIGDAVDELDFWNLSDKP